MILVVDLCHRDGSLSRAEFVGPVERILRENDAPFIARHYSAVEVPEIETVDAAILCGTALRDTGFMEHPKKFEWLSRFERPVLGISSGMHALAAVYGGDEMPCCEIGMTDVRVVAPDPLLDGQETFSAYELHEYAVQTPAEFIPLAVSDQCVQVIRHRSLPLYGLQFHPEVRNEWLIERFLEMVAAAR